MAESEAAAAPEAVATAAAPATPAPAKAGESPIPGISVPGMPDMTGGSEGALAFFRPDAVPYALAVIIGTALVVRLVQRLATGLAERVMEHRLVVKQAVTLLGFAAYGVAGVIAVSALFELSAQAIFALSGTLAVAGGFLLKDVAVATVAGVSILASRPFQVGDRISFGGYYGEVKDIGLRSVRLVTPEDSLVTIPSSRFLTDPVASANAGSLDCMVVIPFFVAPQADLVRVQRIVRDAVLSSRYLYLGKPVSVLVAMRLGERTGALVEVTAKAYVYDARHERSFASDVTERVLRAFQAKGVPLPSAAA